MTPIPVVMVGSRARVYLDKCQELLDLKVGHCSSVQVIRAMCVIPDVLSHPGSI